LDGERCHSIPDPEEILMDADEKAIRDLVATWLSATKAGDTAMVLSLMSDDVVFMVPGKEPFDRE